MEIVSTVGETSNRKVVRGTDIFWFRFVYFTAGSTYALDNGADIPILNYESFRSSIGFGTITFKGVVVAEIGHGENDPFPGGVSGPIAPRYSYSLSTTLIAFTSANAACIGLLTAGNVLTTRVRRITILNPGNQTTAALDTIHIKLCTSTQPVVAGSSANLHGTFDSLDPVYSGTTNTGGTVSNVGSLGTGNSVDYTFFTPTALAAFVPGIIDFQGQGYLKGPVAHPGQAILIYGPTSVIGHANFVAIIEFTEDNF